MSVSGKHLEGYAYGGNRPHSRHEHIQHPNTVVIHNHDGIEALNLNTGAPYARLQLGEEKTVFADVNDDGAIERVKTNFDGENCDAEVVTLQPTAQVCGSRIVAKCPCLKTSYFSWSQKCHRGAFTGIAHKIFSNFLLDHLSKNVTVLKMNW